MPVDTTITIDGETFDAMDTELFEKHYNGKGYDEATHFAKAAALNTKLPRRNVPFIRTRLRVALETLDRLPDEGPIPLCRLLDVVHVQKALAGLGKSLPEVEAWCVVKHYRPRNGSTMRLAVWTGHLTEAQARAFRGPIEDYYKKPIDYGDTWEVEFRTCDLGSVIDSVISPEEYIRWLGPRY